MIKKQPISPEKLKIDQLERDLKKFKFQVMQDAKMIHTLKTKLRIADNNNRQLTAREQQLKRQLDEEHRKMEELKRTYSL